MIGAGDLGRERGRMRSTDGNRFADRAAARDHVAQRALLRHHGRCEDEIGPRQVLVLQRIDVHVHQA